MSLESSTPPTAASFALLMIFFFIGASAWWLQLRPGEEVDPTSIGRISRDLAGWKGQDVPLGDTVERMLRADFHVQRAYLDAKREPVWLYIGYYGTQRGGRPEHTPWVCYPSSGWVVLSALEMDLGDVIGAKGRGGRFNELVVEQNGERRLVYFWYATHRSTAIADQSRLTLDHMLGRLSRSGRADGALVRLSTPILAGGIPEARARLQRFSRPLVDQVQQLWPNPL